MSDLTSMVNIGREMSRKLQAVGISSPEQLRETGAMGAYLRLKSVYPHVCLVHLYALEGAVRGVDFNASRLRRMISGEICREWCPGNTRRTGRAASFSKEAR